MPTKKLLRQSIFRLMLLGLYAISLGAHSYHHAVQAETEQHCVVCLGFSGSVAKLFVTNLEAISVAESVLELNSVMPGFVVTNPWMLNGPLARGPPSFHS